MFYHLILTDACNLNCRYCRGKPTLWSDTVGGEAGCEIDRGLPVEFSANLDDLYGFLTKDPAPVLTFYGGEPLLRADLVARILEEAPVRRFMLQTNGILLDKLAPSLVNKFETILISIDGPPSVTDANRGSGVYRKVVSNARRVLRNGYSGELIARMTITEGNDIFRSVRFLSNGRTFRWPAVHWQLDAGFSQDFESRDFAGWARTSYNPGIARLAQVWIREMEKNGRVMRWYPFIDTMDDLLNDNKTRLRCGAGYSNYSIMTDGNIAPCPAMIGMTGYYNGTITNANPVGLGTTAVGEPCDRCEILDFCGGRCLYSNILTPWPKEGRLAICNTIHHLRRVLLEALPAVRELLDSHIIDMNDFHHTKYNGCEIIP